VSRSPSDALRGVVARGLRWMPGRAARVVLVEGGLWDPAALRRYDSAAAWCKANPGRRAEAWVAGTELHQLVCAAGVPLDGPAALAAYARQLFTHYHGMAAQAWPLATWYGPAGRGASVAQGPHVEQWLSALPDSVLRPLWMAALRWALCRAPELAGRAEARLLLVEGALTTRITLRRGRCADVQTARLAEAKAAALVQALQAERPRSTGFDVILGYGLASELPHLDGTRVLGSLTAAGPPADWLAQAWPRPLTGRLPGGRFERGPLRLTPGLAWVALACALAVFGTAVQQAHGAWEARQRAYAAQLGLPEVPTTAPADADRGPAPWQADAAQVTSLAEALQRPWSQWLQGIEAVSGPQVQWLDIEFDAQGEGGWRLRGQVPDHGAGLRLARDLAQQTQWAGARLASLQQTQPGSAVPFEIQAPARIGPGR
jgi:hypothetical protein